MCFISPDEVPPDKAVSMTTDQIAYLDALLDVAPPWFWSQHLGLPFNGTDNHRLIETIRTTPCHDSSKVQWAG
jgi:hypothetical protein